MHLISQQRDNCDREINEIQNIRLELAATLDTCRKARSELKIASQNLTLSSFNILENYRKRQNIKEVLKAVELIQNLQNVEKNVATLIANQQYEAAIDLILKSKKAAASNKEFTCVKDLAVKLQDVLEMTEERLDMVLANICYNFDEKIFCQLRNAYQLLGKSQSSMEQLHMHYSSAVNESAMLAMKPYVTESNVDNKFQNICSNVPLNKSPQCLMTLSENLFKVMKSYKLLVNWHNKNDAKVTNDDSTLEIERNVSREYIRQKLQSGLVRIWNDVQGKVSTFLKSTGLEEYPFEKFIQMLGILKRLTQVAEVFCGDTSDILQDFIKNQSVSYIKNYHNGRMEELKLFLENEGWELCPVKQTFNLLNLQEFKPFKKYLSNTIRSDVSIAKSCQSDGASSANSQEDSLYIAKYFNSKSNRTPFDIFHDENVTNDDIFGLETEFEASDESDDEPEELKRDYVEDDGNSKTNSKESPSKLKNSVIVTNTTLSVLRNCGQYLQICRYLPQISLEVVMLMNQLFDYYFYTVHLFFTADLEVASTTLYSSKLNATLKRISNAIDTKANELNGKSYACPNNTNNVDTKNEATLHGMTERSVAIESVVFLAKQYDMLQPYIESIVAPHQRMIIEHFKDNTLAISQDLRVPVYMASVSKSIDARTVLISMSQVKWDIKSVAVEHSGYVDIIVRQIQVFSQRLDNILCKIPLSCDAVVSIWTQMAKFIVHLLVEGYSNATKCSNGGRGLMQLDYRQLFVKFEKVAGLKPVPFQDYVDKYVKAYYLPRNGLEEFVQENSMYSNKHLMALVTCACENKRDRQELIAIIDNKES